MKIETLAIHTGAEVDSATGAVAQPIVLSSTFERDASGEYSRGFMYTRHNNPNRLALEKCLAALEGGAAAAAFSSGSAAAMAVFQTLKPGDHLIAPNDMYHGVAKLLKGIFASWNVSVSFVDMTVPQNIQAAIKPHTRLIWIETPSNPQLRITDIRETVKIAKGCGAITVCDNTFSTPVQQRPLEMGVDLVVHSTTKYLGGHSDVLGGAVVAPQESELFSKIREVQVSGGAVPSPFDCFLVLRGIRTLPYRMRAQTENAGKLARFLQKHPGVEKVFYPGLEDHPGHAIAKKQCTGFGAMVSILVKGGSGEALKVAARTKLFIRATSLGGVESLIEHRASVEGPDTQTPQNLLRLSVGLEHIDDLTGDLDTALKS